MQLLSNSIIFREKGVNMAIYEVSSGEISSGIVQDYGGLVVLSGGVVKNTEIKNSGFVSMHRTTHFSPLFFPGFLHFAQWLVNVTRLSWFRVDIRNKDYYNNVKNDAYTSAFGRALVWKSCVPF